MLHGTHRDHASPRKRGSRTMGDATGLEVLHEVIELRRRLIDKLVDARRLKQDNVYGLWASVTKMKKEWDQGYRAPADFLLRDVESAVRIDDEIRDLVVQLQQLDYIIRTHAKHLLQHETTIESIFKPKSSLPKD